MNPFTYVRPDSVEAAVGEAGADPGARFIAGGTNLVDLMKENVERPTRLIDISRMALKDIKGTAEGLRLGAMARNTDVAYNQEVERRYPLLAKAVLAGASPQLRNAATVGGNLLQRTRCCYFYDTATDCNKRAPGAGCSALAGFNRMHAVLGASARCIAVHPSDMCVALAMLDAVVRVTGADGERSIPFGGFHRLPGDTPHIETDLKAGELITAVDLPLEGFPEHHCYLKIRDRASYAFALVSVAAALEMDGETIVEGRCALGGVAHKPWRDKKAETLLNGRPATAETFERFAQELLRHANGFGGNTFKIDLARRAVVRALSRAASGEEKR